MSQFKQYHDANLYFSNSRDNGEVDKNGYLEHDAVSRDEYLYTADMFGLDSDTDNDNEILEILNTSYTPERLPTNGETSGYVTGKATHNANTSDLHSQAMSYSTLWSKMAQGYAFHITGTRRWKAGFNPTAQSGKAILASKIKGEQAKMARDASYEARQAKRLAKLRRARG